MITLKITYPKQRPRITELTEETDYLTLLDLIVWQGGDWTHIEGKKEPTSEELGRFGNADFVKRITWLLLHGRQIILPGELDDQVFSLGRSRSSIQGESDRDHLMEEVNTVLEKIRVSLHGMDASLNWSERDPNAKISTISPSSPR